MSLKSNDLDSTKINATKRDQSPNIIITPENNINESEMNSTEIGETIIQLPMKRKRGRPPKCRDPYSNIFTSKRRETNIQSSIEKKRERLPKYHGSGTIVNVESTTPIDLPSDGNKHTNDSFQPNIPASSEEKPKKRGQPKKIHGKNNNKNIHNTTHVVYEVESNHTNESISSRILSSTTEKSREKSNYHGQLPKCHDPCINKNIQIIKPVVHGRNRNCEFQKVTFKSNDPQLTEKKPRKRGQNTKNSGSYDENIQNTLPTASVKEKKRKYTKASIKSNNASSINEKPKKRGRRPDIIFTPENQPEIIDLVDSSDEEDTKTNLIKNLVTDQSQTNQEGQQNIVVVLRIQKNDPGIIDLINSSDEEKSNNVLPKEKQTEKQGQCSNMVIQNYKSGSHDLNVQNGEEFITIDQNPPSGSSKAITLNIYLDKFKK